VILLLMNGHETVTYAIGNGMIAPAPAR